MRFRAGGLDNGWSAFYADVHGDDSRPHLRTYGSGAEKFREAFLKPLQPERAHKVVVAGPGASSTWGVGGTHKTGRVHLEPREATGLAVSRRRFLSCELSESYDPIRDMGSKARVYNAAGVDVRRVQSNGYDLENMLQKKVRTYLVEGGIPGRPDPTTPRPLPRRPPHLLRTAPYPPHQTAPHLPTCPRPTPTLLHVGHST